MPNPMSRREEIAQPVLVAEAEERVRADASDFMAHTTNGSGRRMCRVGFQELTRVLAHYDQLKRASEVQLAAARKAALLEAAAICAEQERTFGSEEYAVGQPFSSLSERFACRECRHAIEALLKADAILSLPSEHEGLVGELREARSVIVMLLEAGGANPRSGIVQFSCWSLSKLSDAWEQARSALRSIDQALAKADAQGLTTSRADVATDGDVLAGKEG